MQDANKNRLYVHEVFVADGIKKGDTLQTAASQPHGGISLYRDILANVLENGQTSEQVQNSQSSICENSESVISDKEKAQKKAGNQQESAGNVENDAPEASEKSDEQRASLRRQKSESPVSDATPKERALRDALNDVLTSAGIDVVTDVEEGQRVLDEVNGNARMMAKKRALKTASLSEDTERSLTVVSSAQGANILNNLDTLISSLENSATQPKTFIGDVAKALGAIGFVQLGTRRQFRKAAYGDAHCEVEHQGLRRMAHRKGE